MSRDAVPFSAVQSLSRVRLFATPVNRSTPGLPVHHQLPEFTQTRVHRVSDAIQPSILGRPLLLLPPIPPSIKVFSNESTLCMRWPGAQYATGGQWKNKSGKSEGMELKQKQYPAVDVTGDRSKIRRCKEQFPG